MEQDDEVRIPQLRQQKDTGDDYFIHVAKDFQENKSVLDKVFAHEDY